MTREKFPEKIPFRLTRMLINAMEVTGIEGTYRRTCESVMSVLHRNKDSLMAVLEAFVYDPLLNWRLMDNAAPKGKRSDAQGMSASSSQEHGDMLDSLTATLPKKGVPCSIENGGTLSLSTLWIFRIFRIFRIYCHIFAVALHSPNPLRQCCLRFEIP
jgi:FKBP12-rapamycin complex-associated protein